MTGLSHQIRDVATDDAPLKPERITHTAGDPVEAALRLGSAVLGCPLVFAEAGADQTLHASPPAFVTVGSIEPVYGDGGEPLGTLRAVTLAPRAPFDADERAALADVATLIGAEKGARLTIGRVNSVTGLPNREAFERDLLAGARRDRFIVMVTIADPQHYNELLRALGHGCAENFVRRGAEIVASLVGDGRRIYHVSVLSFAFVMRRITEDAPAMARDIAAAFTSPVVCDGLPIATRAGVGVTRYDAAINSPSETLRSALAAAQDSRRMEAGFAFYDRRSDQAHRRAFSLLADLAVALSSRDQLALAYQPRIELATGKVASAEALIRWNHPKLGPISPAEFIPLAETTALIDNLTDWVLERAARQSAEWTADGVRTKISVNVSPSSLRDGGFVARMHDIIASARADPCRLEFEFTEGTLTSADAGVREKIEAIRAAGVTIAIDDFGTGYSNLDYLTRLPADVLKIDRCFIQPLDREHRHRRLVRSMIDMSHDLGFQVVAEGVETASAYEMLGGWGCEEGQGYYMSRPLPPDTFKAFVGRAA